MSNLNSKRVAILATDGFERSELEQPYNALKKAGAEVDIVSINDGIIRGWSDGNWSGEVKVDKTLSQVSSKEYNGLVLPGGVINPDKLRNDSNAVGFVNSFFEEKKPVAAICHGPWTMIETNKLKGRKVTSYPSLKTDLVNAGAVWVDEEVVVDQGIVTSRSPKDLPAFCSKIIEEVAEGKHDR